MIKWATFEVHDAGNELTSTVKVWDSFDDGKRYLIDRIKREEEMRSSWEDEATDFCHLAEDVNLWSESFGPQSSEWVHEIQYSIQQVAA